MEAKERRCAGCVISCFQDEDFEVAKGPPIQWMARKREDAPPNSSNASEPEPGGDGKRELERDPSGGMSPQEGKSERRLSQEAAKRNTKPHNKPRGKGKEDTPKERKRGRPKPPEKPHRTVGKQAGSPCLTLRWEVLMLNQELVGNCLEFLLGKPSASVQMN